MSTSIPKAAYEVAAVAVNAGVDPVRRILQDYCEKILDSVGEFVLVGLKIQINRN